MNTDHTINPSCSCSSKKEFTKALLTFIIANDVSATSTSDHTDNDSAVVVDVIRIPKPVSTTAMDIAAQIVARARAVGKSALVEKVSVIMNADVDNVVHEVRFAIF